MEPVEQTGFCPHCSNVAQHRLVHTQKYLTHGYYMDGRKTEDDVPCAYFVATCRTCNAVLVYLAEGDVPSETDFVAAGLVWPEPGILNESVPESVRKCYGEAVSVKRRSPSSFAVQVRRSLEALCTDRKAEGRTLHDKLAWLATRGELPQVLVDMTGILRLLGNKGAHASDEEVQPGHVDAIDEFFRAIIEYVYVAPEKIKRLRKALDGKASIF
jgi:Domain of unknown function (DUF4145)